jgi:hypothetical protein
VEDAWRRRDLSAGFDEAAEVYQRTRPVCPPQLFDDLIGLAGLSPGNRVVEIGCGTGQAILATQSGTRALDPARGADFLSRVSGRLDSLGSPELTTTFVGYLTVGRRLDFRPENRNSEGTGR